jgi:hypothetical protein
MNRSALGTVGLLAVVAAVVLAAGQDDDGASGEVVPTMIGLEAPEVRRVVLRSGDRQADVVRADDGWLAAPGTPEQAAALMYSLEDELFPLRAYRSIEGDPADPQYGLTAPQMSVTVSDGSGRDAVLLVGGPSFSDAGAYAQRLGRAGLYLLPRRTTDLLRSVLTGEAVASADPIGERADRYATERQRAETEEKITPYLQQVLDAGATIPAEAG